jgi:hypothetical protein
MKHKTKRYFEGPFQKTKNTKKQKHGGFMQSIHAVQNREMILRFLPKKKKHNKKKDEGFMQSLYKMQSLLLKWTLFL